MRPASYLCFCNWLGGAVFIFLTLSSSGAQEPPFESPPNMRFGQSSLSFGQSGLSFPQSPVRFSSTRLAQPLQSAQNELRFRLTADVLFDFDRADLRRNTDAVLRDLLQQVRARFPRPMMQIEGHTDSVGDDVYNDALSLRRAEAIRSWITGVGALSPSAVRAQGFGKRRPVAPNRNADGSDNPIGRQQNRRVEIVATAGR